METTDLFEQICSLENLFYAWDKFSMGKHSKKDVMAFEYQLEDYLFSLRDELLSGKYLHDPYQPFTIFDPKQRQIHKSSVRDRVVHQALVNVIEPFFENKFIHDSYSCRIGKGTHEAVKRLRTFLWKESENNTRTIYALKCDIRKFFASVDHQVLLELLRRRITDQRTLGLITNIIESFSTHEGRGIPLGNLTSQLFANVYLNELDRFVKHDLRERRYLRYCDDFIILGRNPQSLNDLIPCIDAFLGSKLRLSLHPKKVFIRSWVQGIDFLGYVLLPHATAIRPKTKERMLKLVSQDNVASYLGVCSHADAFELEQVVRTKCAT